MKTFQSVTPLQGIVTCSILFASFVFLPILVSAQQNVPILKAKSDNAIIADGPWLETPWKLSPEIKPDIYYVNIPAKENTIRFSTDLESLTITTKPGETYNLLVVLAEKDTCYVQISSKPPKNDAFVPKTDYPITVPFTMIESRIYFKGFLNGKEVNIQFDLGAGTNVVNKESSEKLGLQFNSTTTVNNTQGVNESGTSTNNTLTIGKLEWNAIPVTEVGNMHPHEDIIIGNGLFANHILEINYDTKEFILYNSLPEKIKTFSHQPVYYIQNRPFFEAAFEHNGKTFTHWFLFDTGREGTMLVGEDFTQKNNNWEALHELVVIKGRKIIRLTAQIGGITFTDIVTNATDPNQPTGRPSLFGNQVLNHFNVILDNTLGELYLKPNSLMPLPYSDYSNYEKEMAKMKPKN